MQEHMPHCEVDEAFYDNAALIVGQSVHSKVDFDDRHPIFDDFSVSQMDRELLKSHFSFDLENTHNPSVMQSYIKDAPICSSRLDRLADIEAL